MEIEIICQLLLATLLGALIGLEREYKKKGAGLQTFSLVALGACLLTVITLQFGSFNPAIIQAIAIGIGFIGAGVIFRQPSGAVGLTTAAGLWTTAAIGIATGTGLYFLAIFTTLLVLLVLSGLGLLEEKIFQKEQ
jgi:putative Mg2+ transporter-C (MgtC) family protein